MTTHKINEEFLDNKNKTKNLINLSEELLSLNMTLNLDIMQLLLALNGASDLNDVKYTINTNLEKYNEILQKIAPKIDEHQKLLDEYLSDTEPPMIKVTEF